MMGNLKEQGTNHRDGTGFGSGEAHQEVIKAGRGARGEGRGSRRGAGEGDSRRIPRLGSTRGPLQQGTPVKWGSGVT